MFFSFQKRKNISKDFWLVILRVSLDSSRLQILHVYVFFLGPMNRSRDPQVRNLAKSTLKLGPTTLFTHLKIILLQCFQFSAIIGIQTDLVFPIGLVIICRFLMSFLVLAIAWKFHYPLLNSIITLTIKLCWLICTIWDGAF